MSSSTEKKIFESEVNYNSSSLNNNNNQKSHSMKVAKRDGRLEPVSFDKVINRLSLLAGGTDKTGKKVFGKELSIDVTPIAQRVINEIRDGISTRQLDECAASTCASMIMEHPEYGDMAGRVIMSNHQKNTLDSFVDSVKFFYQHKDKTGKPAPLIGQETYKAVLKYKNEYEEMIDYNRDYRHNYFSYKTLEKSYFLTAESGHFVVSERPQHMWMRVSVGIHDDNLEDVRETYDLLSKGKLMHATPTLFNSGTPTPQFSSCYLIPCGDSLLDKGGIVDLWRQCAAVSKYMGGIGCWLTEVRAKGSMIRSSGRPCDGILPLMKVLNEIGVYINQGGRRKGSIAAYCEPWHADMLEFLDMKKTHGDQTMRALDLFYALWVPDLFMDRVDQHLKNPDAKIMWSLMCPDECPGLSDNYGDEFEKLYHKYEREGKYKKQIPIGDLWQKILDSQKETGSPYMLYKDHVNHRNNQSNIGVVKSSNLCCEITEVSDPDKGLVACCNLANVPVNVFYDESKPGKYDWEGLGNSVRVATQNLDRIIDKNFYPSEETERSNMLTRPCAIGIQGLADLFFLMRYPFESEEARELNRSIYETLYYYAMKTSIKLAKEKGVYPGYEGSPTSEGKFQFDLWNEQVVRWNKKHPDSKRDLAKFSGMYDWDELRGELKEFGCRNSLLIAQMPCASNAQIQGNNESFEPVTRNVYVRRVLSGEFKLVNNYMQNDLMERGLWTDEVKSKIIRNRGSIQSIDEIPKDIKDLYKDAYEIKQRAIIDQAADRSPFVDQAQSMNIFLETPTDNKLTSVHMYGWKNLLKTGMYYLRREAIAKAVQFTVKPVSRDATPQTLEKDDGEPKLCLLEDPDCIACQ